MARKLDGRTAAAGDPGPAFPPLLSDEAWRRAALRYDLTPREQEVAALLARADEYADICRRLGMSRPTLRTHVRAAYRKVACSSRIELILRLVHEFL